MTKRLDKLERRAAARHHRRLYARMGHRMGPQDAELRQLEDEAEQLHKRILDRMGPDPLLSQLSKAQEVLDSTPDPDEGE